VAEEDHVIARTRKGLWQAPRQDRIVLADYRVGPAYGDVVREQPTIVGMVIDDEKLEQTN
jgi:hypothetical protein